MDIIGLHAQGNLASIGDHNLESQTPVCSCFFFLTLPALLKSHSYRPLESPTAFRENITPTSTRGEEALCSTVLTEVEFFAILKVIKILTVFGVGFKI